MIYVLAALLTLSGIVNLFLLFVLAREVARKTQLEDALSAIKLEQELEKFVNMRYNTREPGGNLQ